MERDTKSFGFEMYDFDNHIITFDDLENKQFWCKKGEKQEIAFVNTFNQMVDRNLLQYDKVGIHPEKELNSFHPDLIIYSKPKTEIAEVKVKNSPLFKADTYGINSQFALTMDLKDSYNYSNYFGLDLVIFIWVKWEARTLKTFYVENDEKTYYPGEKSVKRMAGIWVTKFSKLRNFEIENPPPIHWYKEKFREPTEYDTSTCIQDDYIRTLVEFDPRLKNGNIVKNLTSGDKVEHSGNIFPAGQSSGSYVFDLNNQSIFEKLYFKLKE